MDSRKSLRIKEEKTSKNGKTVRTTARNQRPEVKQYLESIKSGRSGRGLKSAAHVPIGRGRPLQRPTFTTHSIQKRSRGRPRKLDSLRTQSRSNNTMSGTEDNSIEQNRNVVDKGGLPVVTIPNLDRESGPPQLFRQTMDIDDRMTSPHMKISYTPLDISIENIDLIDTPISLNENVDQLGIKPRAHHLSNVRELIQRITEQGLVEDFKTLTTVLVSSIIRSNLGNIENSFQSIKSASENLSSDIHNDLWNQSKPMDVLPMAQTNKNNWKTCTYTPGSHSNSYQ